jgi:PAS domain S-box-containing protein
VAGPLPATDLLAAGFRRWFDELAQQGVFTTDTDLVVRSWNRWLEDSTGHPASGVVGRRLLDLFPELVERGFEAYYRAALGGEIKVLAHGLHRNVLPVRDTQRGESRQSGRIAPLDVDGVIVGTVTVIEDVTERFASERELRSQIQSSEQARALAEEAVRVKDEFLTTLSHEIRTPLNAVLGWTKILLSRTVDSAMLARALEVIDRNALAQTRLIDDMLDTARVMSGKLRLESQPVDLTRVALAAIDVVAPTAAAKGVEIRPEFPPQAYMMMGDPDRLQQIVWNLLVNAVKFTEPGGKVTVGITDSEGLLTLTVTDTGEGITPEFLPQIFERFRQADPSASRRHGGLGIGLSLVRQLVELHAGRIAVRSVLHEGSTFIVTCPSRSELAETGSIVNPADGDAMLAHIRVLVVGGHADAREMLTVALEQYGAQVTAIETATEALGHLDAAARPELPHVIVSDVGESDESGLTMIQTLGRRSRARGGDIPAVAVTPYDRPALNNRVLAAGFRVHLAKPVAPNVLAAAVRKLVRAV